MIDEDVAPIYQIENNLLNRRSFGHSVGYGRHEIKLSKKKFVKHKQYLTYVTMISILLGIGYVIYRGVQKPQHIFVCFVAMCPGFILIYQWHLQEGGEEGHISDLMQCFIHGLLVCLPIALPFVFYPGYLHKTNNSNSGNTLAIWNSLCDNFITFVISAAIYEETMKTLFTHFYYRGHQNSVHWRCLAFSFACSFYEIFEAHVASRKVSVRIDRLLLDVCISWMERLITSHLNALLINQPKFVKNTLLTTIPVRVLGVTVRVCVMLCPATVQEIYVLMITLVFLYISPLPCEFDGKNSYEIIMFKGWCRYFENSTKQYEDNYLSNLNKKHTIPSSLEKL